MSTSATSVRVFADLQGTQQNVEALQRHLRYHSPASRYQSPTAPRQSPTPLQRLGPPPGYGGRSPLSQAAPDERYTTSITVRSFVATLVEGETALRLT